MLKRILTLAPFALVLGACADKSRYERAVENYEPVFCYQNLGGIVCHEKPNFADERRMVNYYGPAPKRYERPAPPPEQKLFAPEMVNYWVKDPEPLPRPIAKGDLTDRPWIAGTPNYDAHANRVATERELQAGTALVDATDSPGNQAFLKTIDGMAALPLRPVEAVKLSGTAKPAKATKPAETAKATMPAPDTQPQ
ncbi:MAG: hypothetical protein VW338_16690 [Rhodospirillaceae bacterium]